MNLLIRRSLTQFIFRYKDTPASCRYHAISLNHSCWYTLPEVSLPHDKRRANFQKVLIRAMPQGKRSKEQVTDIPKKNVNPTPAQKKSRTSGLAFYIDVIIR